jgi:hypothetical protein
VSGASSGTYDAIRIKIKKSNEAAWLSTAKETVEMMIEARTPVEDHPALTPRGRRR